MGIRSFDGDMLFRRAQRSVTGIIAATTGVLFMKAETNAVGAQSQTSASGVLSVLPSILDVRKPTAPTLSIACATMNIPPTVMGLHRQMREC